MSKAEEARRKYNIAKELICLNLEKSMGAEAFNHLVLIRGGDKDILLEHMKALEKIFKDAIIYLEYLIGNDK